MVQILIPIFWVALWFLISWVFNLSSLLLPDAAETLKASYSLLTNKEFYLHILITFGRIIPGNLVSVIVGTPLGLALSVSSTWRAVFEPMLTFLRGVPAAALFPVVIILFGIGELARWMMTLYVVLPIIVTSALYGAIERPENMGRRHYLQVHKQDLAIWHIPMCLLWDALPSIFGGLKIAISLSLVIIIVSEMFFVGGSGVGWFAWNKYQAFNLPKMYATILIIGMMSVALNYGLDKCKSFVENRIS